MGPSVARCPKSQSVQLQLYSIKHEYNEHFMVNHFCIFEIIEHMYALEK